MLCRKFAGFFLFSCIKTTDDKYRLKVLYKWIVIENEIFKYRNYEGKKWIQTHSYIKVLGVYLCYMLII